METTRATATESLGASQPGPSPDNHTPSHGASAAPPFIKVRRRSVFDAEKGKDIDLFTMSIGDDTIELLPLRNWGQLDAYKWRAQGRLPGTPAGLEITYDHVKLVGETVMVSDPDGCAKLEKLFAEWLAMEKQTLELARQKKAKPVVAQQATGPTEPQPLHYAVETDKVGQVHIRCVQGKESVATIGLNSAGFHSLVTQGFLRKPKSLQVGALHDWVELDGVLFSFERGNNDADKLAKALNEKYVPPVTRGGGKDVVIFANPASSTGFDIQFPVSVGGMTDAKRRPLNEESLELLQDPNKCGLLHKGIVIKIARPNLIFKQKTPDGGEKYLDSTPDNLAVVNNDDGESRTIDLSKPVNYLHLSTAELTVVLNHPAIHQHGKTSAPAPPAVAAPVAPPVSAPPVPPPVPVVSILAPPAAPSAVQPPASAASPPLPSRSVQPAEKPPFQAADPARSPAVAAIPVLPELSSRPTIVAAQPVEQPKPNRWLQDAFAKPPIRHDWLACTLYSEIAQHFGNSSPGKLGLSECWSAALSDTQDPEDPAFKGFFLTQKGGFGFLNQGHIVRFNKGVAFLGTQETALEGIDVLLIAAGLDEQDRAVFVVKEPYRNKFGVPPPAVEKELASLRECGILVMGAQELLEGPDPIEILWTVPQEQASPDDIRAEEHVKEVRSPKSEVRS